VIRQFTATVNRLTLIKIMNARFGLEHFDFLEKMKTDASSKNPWLPIRSVDFFGAHFDE
jgi:hypothetical protein